MGSRKAPSRSCRDRPCPPRNPETALQAPIPGHQRSELQPRTGRIPKRTDRGLTGQHRGDGAETEMNNRRRVVNGSLPNMGAGPLRSHPRQRTTPRCGGENADKGEKGEDPAHTCRRNLPPGGGRSSRDSAVQEQASGVRLTLKQACCREFPDSAMCVQKFNDSRGIAIRTTYHISLRSSSM